MRHAAKTRHRYREIDGLRIRYRESGTPAPIALVLLHGSPSSSHSFREVLPVLGETVYAIAPDLPGFGFSETPDEFTSDRLSRVVDGLLESLGVERFVLFVTDFSTPVGYLSALRHPERILGLVVQNGNVHEEGLGEAWDTTRRFWDDPTEANRAAMPEWLDADGTRATYTAGLRDELVELHPEESWHLDWAHLSQPGMTDRHFEFFVDYRTHIERFDEIAAYHAEHQPPCLVLWGRHDPFFDVAEVLAFHRELTTLDAHLFDAGHFLLETHSTEVAELVQRFVRDVVDREGLAA